MPSPSIACCQADRAARRSPRAPALDLIADREADARLAAVAGEGGCARRCRRAPGSLGRGLPGGSCSSASCRTSKRSVAVLAPALPGRRSARQGLAGLREVAEQREAEAALEGARRSFSGVGAQQRGRCRGSAPWAWRRHPRPCSAPRRGRRGALPGPAPIALITRWAALSEEHRPRGPPGSRRTPRSGCYRHHRRLPRRGRARRRPGCGRSGAPESTPSPRERREPQPIGQLHQDIGAGVGDEALAVRPDFYGSVCCLYLHLPCVPPAWGTRPPQLHSQEPEDAPGTVSQVLIGGSGLAGTFFHAGSRRKWAGGFAQGFTGSDDCKRISGLAGLSLWRGGRRVQAENGRQQGSFSSSSRRCRASRCSRSIPSLDPPFSPRRVRRVT